jgi:hypothetical protein
MADQNKFEEMLERLINEDKSGAEELFHEIVVEKSRDIYESLLENDLEEVADEEVDEATDEEVDEATDEEVDEATDEEVDESSNDEEVDENFDLDEFEVEAEPEMGGDPADDMMGDIEDAMDGDEEGDEEEGEEGDVEDRVEDLEDALDDLKAEFEKMMAGDEGGDDEAGDDMDAGDEDDDSEEESFNFGEAEEDTDEAVEEATDEEVDEATEEEVDESRTPKTANEEMREYVEKVTATMGDNGANTKSTVASANDMGGEAGNLVQGSEEGGRTADSAKDETAGNVNVPGGKASKSMKAQPKGHGAEKKGAGEAADNKKSTVGK